MVQKGGVIPKERTLLATIIFESAPRHRFFEAAAGFCYYGVMPSIPEKLLAPYNPKETEARISTLWEESGFFNPDLLSGERTETFSIVLPPPNVTGTLHVGHAMMLAVEDILVRYHRMKGDKTLWIPGTDHAAIATQAKVESELYKKEKKTRNDIGRDEFLVRVKKFAQESHDTIVSQIKRMGASLDWSREAYTLDEARSLSVRTAFKRMYDMGLIYRGYRVINWDPKGQTTISDDEIVYKEGTTTLYTFRYSKDFPISISTTRPETKVGDTAVAVHPDDPRYKKYIGKEYDADFAGTKLHIKIIADESVDKEYGIGALGVTPAHSVSDFELSQKYDLPLKQVINEYARMTDEAGPLVAGQKTKEARETVVSWLRENGLLEDEKETPQNLSTSERTGGIVEPLPKLQWFVSVDAGFRVPASAKASAGKQGSGFREIKTGQETTLKQLMRTAVESGQITILPERFEKNYYHWIDNLRDWCISRQIWFGHRIPVWYCLECKQIKIDAQIKSRWFLMRHGETEANKERRGHTKDEDKTIPLNETGLAQAETAARMLKNEKIDLIISSHYARARQTAEAIARATGAEIIFDEELRERDMGDATELSYDEARAKFADLFEYSGKSANQESYEELEKRIWSAFSRHHNEHRHKNVVVVGHGAAFRTLLRKIRNVDLSLFKEKIPPLANAQPIPLDNLDPCPNCGGHFFEQDPDTLDTWFSSGLWTFSTLGWPNETEDLKTYHPTTLLETGYDILFFWVARMILMSGALLGDIPFKTVYLHGLVRDKDGKKMSKSLGNIIDPVDMVEKFGADAVRMALVVGTGAGNDSNLGEEKIKAYKHFANKLWNITRFILTNTKNVPLLNDESPVEGHLVQQFNEVSHQITADIEEYRLHLAAENLYAYVWHEFADKIIEESKPILSGANEEAKQTRAAEILYIWTNCIKLLHPFMPFITEEIWSMLPDKFKRQELLVVEQWPSIE
ncbi:MAG: class I tRNA ligase family protein [Parcubacteria group bacterium]|nr:class I tRNA ligase family protein [Parcubacteria group bacterium]